MSPYDFEKSYYRFTYHAPDGVKHIQHIPYGHCTKDELIESFMLFLRGCGFSIETLVEEITEEEGDNNG